MASEIKSTSKKVLDFKIVVSNSLCVTHLVCESNSSLKQNGVSILRIEKYLYCLNE